MAGKDASETPKVGEACGQADDARQRHVGSRAGNRKRGLVLGIGRRALAATRARQRVSQASAALESLVTRSDVPCFVLGFEGLGQIWVGGFLELETAKQRDSETGLSRLCGQQRHHRQAEQLCRRSGGNLGQDRAAGSRERRRREMGNRSKQA